MNTTERLIFHAATYDLYLVEAMDELGLPTGQATVRTVWRSGTSDFNEQQLRSGIAGEVASIQAEIDAVTAESARLRDPSVTFTTQQLRNDLARLGDDVARLARDVIRLGRLALRDFAEPAQ